MKNNIRKIYDELVERLREQSRLGSVMGILHWDQEVIMPQGATESRARQMATLAGLAHERATDPAIGNMLERLDDCAEAQFNPHEWCNIQEAKREYERETKVPKALVQELAELTSKGHHIWADAREKNRFSDFAPTLQRLVDLKKEWAGHIDPDRAPYDVNIDVYERGACMADIDPIFDRLKDELPALIRDIKDSPHQPDSKLLEGTFPINKQEALGRRISNDLGFQFDKGRMDVSVHPFCGGADSTDVRITTRYREDNFVESLYAVIHETGHGLYEQGRMSEKEYLDLPVTESLSMGIHESQSLFWERMIAQTKSFIAHYKDLLGDTFPELLRDADIDTLYRAINTCQPSFIRVEADEVTYPLHVILRYEIEKGLFDHSLSVNDLPEIWNTRMDEYLGIHPPTDSLGVLQDVHWSGGAFGYFPSYTLGAMYACQFHHTLLNEMPDLEEHIANGNFQAIRQWLNRNIHSRGRLYSTADLCKKVTGETLNPGIFIDYLKEKYAEIYGLNPV